MKPLKHHKTLPEQIANRCKHFNGVQNAQCKAGVEYRQFDRQTGLPCLRDCAGHQECPQRQWLTEAEVAAEVAEIEAHSKRFMTLLPLIQSIKEEHRGKSWAGVKICPVCAGRLHLSHASLNGHVHGKCETKDCVSWME